MRFRLLRPVEVVGPTGPIALGGPKQRSVLTLLALSANRVVASDRLIAGVWGDAANERAPRPSRCTSRTMRKILRTADEAGPQTVTIDGQRPGYVLRVSTQDVDVFEFSRLIDAGRDALTAGHVDDGAALVAREVEYRVRGLPVPLPGAALADVGRSEAVRLFVLRAKAVRPDFMLTADNAWIVADICRRVDGLPLAIELAVARMKMLSLESIHGRLGSRSGSVTIRCRPG